MSLNTIITTNIIALNTNRNLKLNNKALSSHSKKISSGLKLTSASDDAAGVTISQKMKSQIRGLKQSRENAEEAIDTLDSFDSYYAEIHDMVQRSRELIVQASNDTNSQDDKMKIINEVYTITEEIERVLDTQDFNGKSLEDLRDCYLQIGANSGQNLKLTSFGKVNLTIYDSKDYDRINDTIYNTIQPTIQELLNLSYNKYDPNATVTVITFRNSDYAIQNISKYINNINGSLSGFDVHSKKLQESINKLSKSINDATTHARNETIVSWTNRVNNSPWFYSGNGTVSNYGDSRIPALQNINSITASDVTKVLENQDKDGLLIVRYTAGENLAKSIQNSLNSFISEFKSLDTSEFLFNIKDHLQLILDKNELDEHTSNLYINTYDRIISEVSEIRSKLGVTQNRLDHTISSLQISEENLSYANSQIEDADMAKEMTEYMTKNILVNAAMMILSQSKNSKESVLQLLKQ